MFFFSLLIIIEVYAHSLISDTLTIKGSQLFGCTLSKVPSPIPYCALLSIVTG